MSDEHEAWIGWLVIAGMVAYVYWVGGIKTVWYAAIYHISTDNVHIDPQPTDCDFLHAPLGQKDCHYESHLAAYNAAGALVGGDFAPQYGQDTNTGKPIVSWDKGKTWVWFEGSAIPDQKIKSVVVSWVKAKE